VVYCVQDARLYSEPPGLFVESFDLCLEPPRQPVALNSTPPRGIQRIVLSSIFGDVLLLKLPVLFLVPLAMCPHSGYFFTRISGYCLPLFPVYLFLVLSSIPCSRFALRFSERFGVLGATLLPRYPIAHSLS